MSGSQVGKRKRGAARFTKSAKGKRTYKIQPRQRGYLRRGGYYGRYANGGEMKFLDVDIDDAVVSSTGTIQNGGTINIIAQGVTESERVGRKCVIKAIYWKYEVDMPSTISIQTGSDVTRVILYLDKQANGATAAVTDILETASFQSFRNLANSQRFRILHDRVHVVTGWGGSNAATEETGPNFKEFRFAKKCYIPIEYDNSASTGALTTIRTNNLGVLLISRGGVAGFTSKFRLRFSDA